MSKPQTTQHIIEQFMIDQRLSAEFTNMATEYFLPLADHIAQSHLKQQQTQVVGINGAQGTGKSTLSELLRRLLHARQIKCVVLSIDDLYLTRTQRADLARDIHPLLQTRGVPGTHDLALGLLLLDTLKAADTQSRIHIPRFDKAQDDRRPLADWQLHAGRVDVIILEGWCVGARPVSLSGAPINTLEQRHDADGRWRAFVEQQLQAYQRLFRHIDLLVMLKAPSMDSIMEWRWLQEEKLQQEKLREEKLQEEKLREDRLAAAPATIMDKAEVRRFIMHYERLTRMMWETLPQHADVLFELDDAHNIAAASYRHSCNATP
jgi:D-glycerate 3-kinase